MRASASPPFWGGGRGIAGQWRRRLPSSLSLTWSEIRPEKLNPYQRNQKVFLHRGVTDNLNKSSTRPNPFAPGMALGCHHVVTHVLRVGRTDWLLVLWHRLDELELIVIGAGLPLACRAWKVSMSLVAPASRYIPALEMAQGWTARTAIAWYRLLSLFGLIQTLRGNHLNWGCWRLSITCCWRV